MPNRLTTFLQRGLQRLSRQTPAPPSVSEAKEPASPITPPIEALRPRTIKPLYDSPVYSWTEWDTVGAVKAALSSMEAGIFLSAAQLIEAMGRDDRISGVLETRVRGLLGLDLQWGDPEAEEPDQYAQAASDAFPQMCPEAALAQLASWGVMMGVGLGENIWYDRAGRYLPVPQLKVWSPQFLTWRWDTRSFWVATQSGNIEIVPGDGRWVLYTPYGLQRGWMHGLVRALAVPWLLRQYSMRDSARYGEAYGLPLKQGIVPTDAKKEDKDTFLQQLAALAAESTILTPQTKDATSESKFDLKIHELMGKGHEVFEAQMKRADTNIAVRILGQNLTTEAGTGGKGGAYAASKTHERVRQDVLEADSKTLSTCVRDQVLKPWAAANYGDPELAPAFGWFTEPPEDKLQESGTVLSLSQALAGFATATAPVDARKLLEKFDVPLISPEEEAKMKAEADAKAEADRQTQVDTAAAVAKAKTGTQEKLSAAGSEVIPKGVLEGQAYADSVADQAKAAAAKMLAPDVQAILAAIDKADTYDDVRAALLKHFGQMSPKKLAVMTERALIISRLAGMHAVLQDLEKRPDAEVLADGLRNPRPASS